MMSTPENGTTTSAFIEDKIPQFSESVNTFILVTSAIIIITGILGNSGVLLVVLRLPDMRTPMYLCLMNLSISDLLVLIFVPIVPLAYIVEGVNTNLGVILCYMTGIFERGSLVCSVHIVLLITVERFVVIYYPLRAARLVTKKRTLLLLAIIWILSYGVTAGFVDMTEYVQITVNGTQQEDCGLFYRYHWHDVYLTVISCVFFLFPLLVVIVINILIIRKVMTEPPSDSGNCEGTASLRRRRRQSVILLLLVVVVFVLCLAPFQCFVLVEIYGADLLYGISEHQHESIAWFGRFMAYINSAANPIIYNAVSSNFRSAMLKSLKCRRSKPNHPRAQITTDTYVVSNSVEAVS